MTELVAAIQLLAEDVESLRVWRQKVINREVLKFIYARKPLLYKKLDKTVLEFLPLEGESRIILSSPILDLVREGNSLAHALSIEHFYDSMVNSGILIAIVEDLQQRLSNGAELEQLSKSDLITSIVGVPEPLIKHAIGTLLFCFQE